MSTFTIFAAPATHQDRGALAMAEWRRSARAPVDDVDGGDTAEVAALLHGGLFGGVRYGEIHHVERLTPGSWFEPVGEVHLAGVFTWRRVGDRRRLDPLTDMFDIVWCDDRWAAAEIQRMFTRRNVTLTKDANAMLVERCSDNLVRACAVAQGAAMAGLETLGAAQCHVLLGSQWPGGAVFEVVDLVLDGRRSAALDAGRHLDPVPVASQLTDHLAVSLTGSAIGDARKLAAAVGVHEFVAKKRLAAARRHGPDRLFAALEVATWCSLRARLGAIGVGEVIARCSAALAGATTGAAGGVDDDR